MKTDIEIAQAAELTPITEVAGRIGIEQEDLEVYGKYKAKLSEEYIERIKKNPEGRLILVTAINPTPAGEGSRTVLRHQGRRGGRRVFPDRADGGFKSSLYRRFPCDYRCEQSAGGPSGQSYPAGESLTDRSQTDCMEEVSGYERQGAAQYRDRYGR